MRLIFAHNSLGTSDKSQVGPYRRGKHALCRIKVLWRERLSGSLNRNKSLPKAMMT